MYHDEFIFTYIINVDKFQWPICMPRLSHWLPHVSCTLGPQCYSMISTLCISQRTEPCWFGFISPKDFILSWNRFINVFQGRSQPSSSVLAIDQIIVLCLTSRDSATHIIFLPVRSLPVIYVTFIVWGSWYRILLDASKHMFPHHIQGFLNRLGQLI